jgi:hypothetical protein
MVLPQTSGPRTAKPLSRRSHRIDCVLQHTRWSAEFPFRLTHPSRLRRAGFRFAACGLRLCFLAGLQTLPGKVSTLAVNFELQPTASQCIPQSCLRPSPKPVPNSAICCHAHHHSIIPLLHHSTSPSLQIRPRQVKFAIGSRPVGMVETPPRRWEFGGIERERRLICHSIGASAQRPPRAPSAMY